MGTPARVFLWLVLLLLVSLDVIGIIATTTPVLFPTGNPASPNLKVHLETDGSVILRPPQSPRTTVLENPAPPACSRTTRVADVVAGRHRCRNRPLDARCLKDARPSPAFVNVRQLGSSSSTISRGMVVIGAISTWLWLSRTEMFWILCGSLVLLWGGSCPTAGEIVSAHQIKIKGTSVDDLDAFRDRRLLGCRNPGQAVVDHLRHRVGFRTDGSLLR